MKNPFKMILTNHEVPAIIKNNVLDDINMIRSTFEVADLFLIKHSDTVSDFYIGQEISN